MTNEAVIQAEALSHEVTLPNREPLTILRNASLTVRKGETIAIVGRSGSGKTTLLAILGLLTPITGGTLRIVGESANELGDRQRARLRNRHLGFVFQSYSLVRHLSAYRNVELPLRYGNRIRGRERRTATAEALSLVGLEERKDSRPQHLSGGEQQRVAIARALIRQPSIILADEPTGALDVETADRVLNVLRDAAHARGCAVVVVTHDPHVARQMSRTVRLVDGEINEE